MEKQTFKQLENLVELWAFDKQLLNENNHKQQFLKFIEESGELASAILKNDRVLTADALGDVLVTLIILSKQLGYDLTECLEIAYNTINSRKGKTINGTFIKDNEI